MDEIQKTQVVDKFKACDILCCKHTEFYNKYYNELKAFSFKGKDKRKPLYPLDKVMEIKANLELQENYVIVK